MSIRIEWLKPNSTSAMWIYLTDVRTAKEHVLAHVAFCMRSNIDPLEASTQPTWVVNGRKAVNIKPERKVDRIIISYPLVAILQDFIEDTASYIWYQWQLKLAKKYNITNLWTVYRIASKLWCVDMLEWRHINLSVAKFEEIKKELDSNLDSYKPDKKKWNGDAFFRLMEKLGLSNPEYLFWAVSALWFAGKLKFSKIKITDFELAKKIREEITKLVWKNHGHFTEAEVFQIAETVWIEKEKASKVATVIRAFWFHSDNISR